MINEEEKPISDLEIFTKIWTSPRSVFRYIDDFKYSKFVFLLTTLAGITIAFDNAYDKHKGDIQPLIVIIGSSIIIGSIVGYFIFYVCSWAIGFTGKWLKLNTDTSSILRILSIAMFPSILSLLFLIPQVIVFGNEVFKSNGNMVSEDWILNILVYTSMGFEILLTLWSFYLIVIGVSIAQKTSIWKSMLNISIPLAIYYIPFYLYFWISDLIN